MEVTAWVAPSTWSCWPPSRSTTRRWSSPSWTFKPSSSMCFDAMITTIISYSLSSSGEVGLSSGPSSLHVTFSKHHLPNIFPCGWYWGRFAFLEKFRVVWNLIWILFNKHSGWMLKSEFQTLHALTLILDDQIHCHLFWLLSHCTDSPQLVLIIF